MNVVKLQLPSSIKKKKLIYDRRVIMHIAEIANFLMAIHISVAAIL